MVFNKYGGKCAYCGNELVKGWHADHIIPLRRSTPIIVSPKNKWQAKGSDSIENYNPACASCNINKRDRGIEDFRIFISNFLHSLNTRSIPYIFLKRYGLIEETNKPVIFYFETLNSDK